MTEVALHAVTDDFIAYTRRLGDQLTLEQTTEFLGGRGHTARSEGGAAAAGR